MVFLLLLALTSLFPTPAHAYLDPGTGSYLFQIMLASLIGAAFAIKTYWIKIKKFLSDLLRKKSS